MLNLAISPGVILTPSRIIILDNPIKSFNNILTTATNDMIFGYNANVNKTQRSEKSKKQLQTDRPTEHLESFDTNEVTKNILKNTSRSKTVLTLKEFQSSNSQIKQYS